MAKNQSSTMYIRNIVMSTPLFGVSIKMVQHHQCSMSSSPSRLCWSTCIVVASMIICLGRGEDQFDEHVNTFNIRETTVDPEGNLPSNPSRWVTVAAGVWSKRDRSSHTAEPSKHTSNRAFLHVTVLCLLSWERSQIFKVVDYYNGTTYNHNCRPLVGACSAVIFGRDLDAHPCRIV